VVYMAEQIETGRRKVALKIIKLGMDTKQVVARFESERQGAGADGSSAHRPGPSTPARLNSGRPYFVMELVKGVPITEYADKTNLPLRARLELFAAVLPGGPARASEGDHSPRHQALQRASSPCTTGSRSPR